MKLLKKSAYPREKKIRDLERELDRARNREKMLYETLKRLKSKFNLAQVSEGIIGGVTEATGAVTSTLYTVARDGKIDFTYIYGADARTREKLQKRRLELGQGIAGSVIESKKPYICLDAQEDGRFYKGVDEETGFVTKSMICTPLVLDEKVVGAIQVINKKSEDGRFNEEDLDLLEEISGLAAIALEKANLYEEWAQIDMAKRIQEGILPKEVPSIEGVELAAVTSPAKRLGGDYYDFIPVIDHLHGIIIADISGKGVPAALYMFFARGVFCNFARDSQSPKDVLWKANKFLQRGGVGGTFATSIYAIYDDKERKLVYADAGHGYMAVCRAGKCLDLGKLKGGPPLGLLPDADYEEDTLTLQEGDVIVFHTDGLPEAKNKKGEQFSSVKLEKVIEHNYHESPATIVTAINRAVDEHVAGAPASDDRTLVVMKVEGREERLQKYIKGEYEKREELLYHNWDHTLFVLQMAKRIAQVENANLDIVCAAAILHDIDYLYPVEGKKSEEAAAIKALSILEKFSYSERERKAIAACIRATNPSIKPTMVEEKILRDADNLQFAREDYFVRVVGPLLKEFQLHGEKITREEMIRNTPDFMKNWVKDGYYTGEGKRLGEKGFKENLAYFTKKRDELEKK